jgi:hypothetical protein
MLFILSINEIEIALLYAQQSKVKLEATLSREADNISGITVGFLL